MDWTWPYSRPLYPYPEPESENARRIGLMGVINLTLDSFYDGGKLLDPRIAIEKCRLHISEGADIIDLGAESTRPGSSGVDAATQIDRLRPVIRGLRAFSDVAISIDTSDAEVMRACLAEGVNIINDVCALAGEGALDIVSRSGCVACLMHKQGDPGNMQDNPHYDNVIRRVRRYLYARVVACLEAGIAIDNLIIDPGFGFGKTTRHNYRLLAHLPKLRFGGLPLLVGLSRKSMIGKTLKEPECDNPTLRLEGSLVANAYAVWRGADIVRTHDVAATRRALMAALTISRFHPV